MHADTAMSTLSLAHQKGPVEYKSHAIWETAILELQIIVPTPVIAYPDFLRKHASVNCHHVRLTETGEVLPAGKCGMQSAPSPSSHYLLTC